MGVRHLSWWTVLLGLVASWMMCAGIATADVKKAMELNKEGEGLLNQGKFEQAGGVFRKMLEECGSNQYCQGVGQFYQGRCSLEAARYEEALKLLDQAGQVFEQLQKKNEAAMVVAAKGQVHAGRGDYKTALDQFRKAEATFTELKNQKELFNLYNGIAVVLAYVCDYEVSLDYLDKAEKLLGDSKDPKALGPVNVNKGLVYSKTQDYDKAFEAYNAALKAYRTTGNLKGMSILLNNIGHIHEATSEYDKAVEKHEESLKIAKEIGDPWCEALALNNMGCVQLKRGDYEASRDSLEKALKIRSDLGIKHFAAETLNNMGLVWLAYANYPQAFKSFEDAKQTCDAVGSLSGKAWALHNMAFLFKDQGKFKESLNASQEAVKIAEEIGDRRLESTAVLRLGNLYEYQGWFDKALENYQKAAEIQLEIKDLNFRGNTIADAANVLTRSAALEMAEEHFKEAVSIKQKIGAPSGEVLCKLALFYLEKDRYAGPTGDPQEERRKERTQDIAKAQEQIALAEKAIKPDQKNDLMLLTYVKGRYLLENDPAAAAREFTRLKSMAQEAGVRRYAFLAAVGQGLSYERLENWDEAKKAYREGVEHAESIRKTLDEEAKLTFMDGEEILGVKHILPYEGLARALLRKGESRESLRSAEYTKARIFSESLSKRWENPSFDVPVEVVKRDMDLNNRLAALIRGMDKAHQEGAKQAVESFKREIASVEKDLTDHIAMLRKDYPLFAGSKYPGPLALDDSSLQDGEWVISYDVTESGVLIFLARGKNLVKAVYKPVSRHELDLLVREFRAPMEINPGQDDVLEKLKSFNLVAGKKLADLLLADLLPDLTSGAQVIVIPDDCLGIVPFEMLVLNDSGKVDDSGDVPEITGAEFFGDRNPVSYYQSITALTLSRTLGKKKRPEDRMLIVADPVFQHRDARAGAVQEIRVAAADSQFSVALMSAMEQMGEGSLGFNRLPLTGNLAEGLTGMFEGKSEVYTGLDASKRKLIGEMAPELDQFGRIVFATHGYFSKYSPHFREPILVMTLVPIGTDGFLRMSEVMGLKLNSDVVALTACQTGLGKQISGEGTMGMGRAFQYAGARSVLMSLWSVSEEASVQLVESFFRHLKEGKNRLEAIRLARAQVRRDGYDHPFFWAPFVLVGEVN